MTIEQFGRMALLFLCGAIGRHPPSGGVLTCGEERVCPYSSKTSVALLACQRPVSMDGKGGMGRDHHRAMNPHIAGFGHDRR